MVDCFDRIAVQMTELALEPVHMLATSRMLGAVSLRTPSNGRRYLVTIEKRFPNGESQPPAYAWSVIEIKPGGEPAPDGDRCASQPTVLLDDPVDAYWDAIDGLCALSSP